MENQNKHYRCFILYFKQAQKQRKPARCMLCTEKILLQNACVPEEIFSISIENFFFQDFDREFFWDAQLSGRPTEINSYKVKMLVETNSRYTTKLIANILQTSKSSVKNRLHQFYCVNRLDPCKDESMSQQMSIYDLLYTTK